MATNSKIQWTDHTFNPWTGCTKVSDGCKFCYAETLDKRFGRTNWGPKGTRTLTSKENWRLPHKWNREAQAEGVRKRVFCASMADVFEHWTGPITLGSSEWKGAELYLEPNGSWSTGGGVLASRDRRPSLNKLTMPDVRVALFEMMEETPWLDWQILTKRPENVADMAPCAWISGDWPTNVLLGTSVENQETADERIPHLIKGPAAVRFLSCEPLIGPVSLGAWLGGLDRVHWVIVGGESGPNARPFAIDWAKDIVRQCQAAGVPVFVKQLGSNPTNREGQPCPNIKSRKGDDMAEWPDDLRIREFPV